LFAKWHRWARLNLSQLEIIKPALCDRNRARKWYLGRLTNFLEEYESLATLEHLLQEQVQFQDARDRIQSLFDQKLDRYQQRLLKLYPYIYSQKVEEYLVTVKADIKNLGLHNVIMLPVINSRRA
jgi:hypothetical protein